VDSKSNSKNNVVWFPNPGSDNPEDLIPAYLSDDLGERKIRAATNLSKVHYYLYTNANPEIPDELFVGDSEALKNSHFNPNGKLKFMSHGFGGDIDHSFPWLQREEFLKLGFPINIILVDWSELSASPDYYGAVVNAYQVSKLNAQFLEFLLNEGVTTLDKIHLIGYSLGGQVVGITGNRFTNNTGLTVPHVTSLDPAFPLFDVAEDEDRVSPFSGDFVDVIHTAGGTLGMVQPRGDVDYYPNGGSKQPGCGVDVVGSCAHSRAPAFYRESTLSSVPFKACKCETWAEYDEGSCACAEQVNMGYYVDIRARGKFYLRTNAEEPYAIAEK
jgi:hypothetical protein